MNSKTNLHLEKSILNEYDLCDYCLGRLLSKLENISSKSLGKKIRKKLGKKESKKCYICKNLMANLDGYIKKSLDATNSYKFDSFLFGAVIKPSINERDDQLRSKFKLRVDGIKTEITKHMSKKFAKKTKAVIDYLHPDLTITVNFKDDYCDVRAKSVIVFGRYTKKSREIPQKQKSCESCLGRGCFQCSFHGMSGYDSVEGNITKYMISRFGCRQVKITWIGGEDKTSLVMGNGRPFFAKLIEPHTRKPRFPKKIDLGDIGLSNLRVVEKIPSKPLRFKSKVAMTITCDSKISQKSIEYLKSLKGRQIILDNDGKSVPKHVYGMNIKNTNDYLLITMTVDGGLPIKRFVSDDRVSPNLTSLLDSKCVCTNFDFKSIDIQR